jgi:hypothetical protein
MPPPALALLLLSLLNGEDVPNPRPGEDPYAQYGYRFFGDGLACLGDLDGDGREEFTVSDPSGTDPATVWILSGADAHVVDRLSARECGRMFGFEVARVPDVDRDGVDEIAVASQPEWDGTLEGRVTLFSGRTRAPLRVIEGPPNVAWFGSQIAGLSDVDGDGCGDVLVSGGDRNSVRCGFVYSGSTGELLREIWRPNGVDYARVFPVGDIDGDERVDVALTGTEAESLIPVAFLSSPRDGRSLGVLRGTTQIPDRGVFALRLGDLEQSQLQLLSNSLVEAFSCAGHRIYSMRTQAVPYEVYQAGFGSIGDLDGDGVPDFVLADPEDGCLMGSVACRSGRTGKILWQEPAWPSWRNVELWHMGRYLAVIGDFDQDGVRDFIWATNNSMNGNPGLVFISSGKTGRALKVLARGPNLEILRLGPKE